MPPGTISIFGQPWEQETNDCAEQSCQEGRRDALVGAAESTCIENAAASISESPSLRNRGDLQR